MRAILLTVLTLISFSSVASAQVPGAKWSLRISDYARKIITPGTPKTELEYSSDLKNATISVFYTGTAADRRIMVSVREPAIATGNGGFVSGPEYYFQVKGADASITQGFHSDTINLSNFSAIPPRKIAAGVKNAAFSTNSTIPGFADIKIIEVVDNKLKRFAISGTSDGSVSYNLVYNWAGEDESLVTAGLSASASSEYASTFSADKAINGTPYWISRNGDNQNASLSINLSKLTRISKVEAIFYSTSYLPSGVSSYVSGQPCGPFSFDNSVTLPCTAPVRVFTAPVITGPSNAPMHTFRAETLTETSTGNKFTVDLKSTTLPYHVVRQVKVYQRPDYFPWQNQANKYDVNNDKVVNSNDAAAVIDFLNRYGSNVKTPITRPAFSTTAVANPFFDVNGDGYVSPTDYLQVGNHITRGGAPGTLSQTTGGLKQLEFHNNIICGVNDGNDVYCADQNLQTSPNWTYIPGKMKHISLNNGRLYAVDPNDYIFYSASYKNVRWVQMPGMLKQVSLNGSVVCGVNSANTPYCADTNIEVNPNWRALPGQFKHIAVSNGRLFAIDTIEQIFFAPDYTNVNWTKVWGALKQISFDGDTVCGVNSVNQTFCAEKNIETNPYWFGVPSSLKNVSLHFNKLMGVGPNGQVMYTPYYK